MDFTKLAEYGSVGIALASLMLAGFCIKMLYSIVCNHLAHNTRAIEQLTKVITQLSTFLKNNNKKKRRK